MKQTKQKTEKRKFCNTTPCKDCPFRKGVEKLAESEKFSKERYEALQSTVKQGLGQPVFACHKSTEEAPLACVGYLLVEGGINFSVRIAVIEKRLDFSKLFCKEELYESYEEMAKANGVFIEEIER